MNGKIHSFETFGSVDGPGVRFVIFLKGCIMRCKYCHNPDTWFGDGESYTAEEIITRALKYKTYWGKDGGITVSGGEPMLQIDFLTELFKLAKSKNINTCLDTSGVVFDKNNTCAVDSLLENTNLVMLDLKHINDDEHKKLTGVTNKNILEFAKYLDEKNIPVWIRHVVVPEITLKDKYLFELGEFIGKLSNVKRVETLPYHSMAKIKYNELKLDYPLGDIPDATHEQADYAKSIIDNGIESVR